MNQTQELEHMEAARGAAPKNTHGNATMPMVGNTTASKNLTTCEDTDLVDQIDLAGYFGCTDRTVRSMVARGELPPPVRLGGKARWLAGNVRNWIADRAAREEERARKYFQKIENRA